MFRRWLFLLFLLPAASVLAEELPSPTPDTLVKQMVEDVLAPIKQGKEMTQDPGKIDELVDAKIFPRLDFIRLTRLTVGNKYWMRASPEQQQQLISAYHVFLVHVFSDVIAQYTDQTIFYFPLKMRPDAKEVTVKTVVMDPRDESTLLDYRLEKTETGWLVYDLDIDNMSLIRIYHSNFGDTLSHGGVPNLVGVLHKKNQEVVAARHE